MHPDNGRADASSSGADPRRRRLRCRGKVELIDVFACVRSGSGYSIPRLELRLCPCCAAQPVLCQAHQSCQWAMAKPIHLPNHLDPLPVREPARTYCGPGRQGCDLSAFPLPFEASADDWGHHACFEAGAHPTWLRSVRHTGATNDAGIPDNAVGAPHRDRRSYPRRTRPMFTRYQT